MKANVFFAVLALVASGGAAQAEPLVTSRITPDEFKWDRTPTGIQRAMLVGVE